MKNKKLNIETIKTVIIAVLIAGAFAFVSGIKYQEGQYNQIKTEAVSIVKLSK